MSPERLTYHDLMSRAGGVGNCWRRWVLGWVEQSPHAPTLMSGVLVLGASTWLDRLDKAA